MQPDTQFLASGMCLADPHLGLDHGHRRIKSIAALDADERQEVAAVIADTNASGTVENWLVTEVVPTIDEMEAHPEAILSSKQLCANIAQQRANAT